MVSHFVRDTHKVISTFILAVFDFVELTEQNTRTFAKIVCIKLGTKRQKIAYPLLLIANNFDPATGGAHGICKASSRSDSKWRGQWITFLSYW